MTKSKAFKWACMILFALLLLNTKTFAQTGVSFVKVSDSPTKNVISFVDIEIAGKTFKGASNPKTGTSYIIRVSKKSGNTYKMYLGYKTQHLYNNHPVWSNKEKSKYWYYIINKNGYPKKVKLKVK